MRTLALGLLVCAGLALVVCLGWADYAFRKSLEGGDEPRSFARTVLLPAALFVAGLVLVVCIALVQDTARTVRYG